MSDKMHLLLLILCGVWFQEITGAFVDGEIRKPSDILVRQKRVFNQISSENRSMSISRFPYIVKIKQNGRLNCVGSILSNHAVITSAVCVMYEVPQYQVVCGAANINHGTTHNVTDIKRRYGGHTQRPTDGIGLLIVNPPFAFGAFVNSIQLHSGLLLPGTIGTVTGWGQNPAMANKNYATYNRNSLRSIEVPIMAHRDCVHIYRPHNIQISDKDICTHHPQKHCGSSDGGAPLVVDGHLAGVHLWTGPRKVQCDTQYPDVFAILQHSEFIQWIRSNI